LDRPYPGLDVENWTCVLGRLYTACGLTLSVTDHFA